MLLRYESYFRDQLIAASLKEDLLVGLAVLFPQFPRSIDRGLIEGIAIPVWSIGPCWHFRDQLIAASLKAPGNADDLVIGFAFPRSIDRGLIEGKQRLGIE